MYNLIELVVADLRRLYPLNSDPAIELAIDELRNMIPKPTDCQLAMDMRTVLTTYGIDPFGQYETDSTEATLIASYMRIIRRIRESRTC